MTGELARARDSLTSLETELERERRKTTTTTPSERSAGALVRKYGELYAQTRLDTLDGTVTTQETPRGRSSQLSQIEARSGVLAAAGQVAISPAQQLSGRVTVDLPGGVIGVPLALGGTVAAPEVTLTRSAMLGAAVGTMVMPGVGTGAGARLGDRLGQGLKGLSGGK